MRGLGTSTDQMAPTPAHQREQMQSGAAEGKVSGLKRVQTCTEEEEENPEAACLGCGQVYV